MAILAIYERSILMPSVFLNSGDNFVAASAAEIFGGAGDEQVSIQAGVTGVSVDQNVERVDLPGSAADFAFQQAGNTLQVFSGTTLVATIPLQANGTQVVFGDGSVAVTLTAGVMSLGGTTVSPTTAAAVVPTTIDSTVTSATASSGSNTGGGNTGNPNAVFTADKTSVDEGGSVTYTVTGNAGDTFTYSLTGAGASPAQPTDFTSSTSGSVTIATGATTAQFSVTTTSQDGAEFAETFSVTLTDSANNTIGALSATINDTNNNDTAAPVVTAPGASLNYNENQAAGATIGTVTATDNVGVTGYAIASGNNGDFAIDNSGVITLTAQGASSAANDFETTPNSITLGITASDASGNTSTATDVVLDVKDVDDVAPTLSAVTLAGSTATLTFSEGLASIIPSTSDFTVTIKGVTSNVNVNQATVSGSTVLLSLAVAPAAGETFQVSYAPGTTPLTDIAGNAVAAITTTDVLVDTVAPNITASQAFSYQEGQNDDTADVVGKVTTDDASVATFVIESGNANGFYAIDGSGNITMTAAGLNASGAANDFETTPNQFTLGISATDGAGNKSATTDITINITDNTADNLAAPIITNLTTGADPANGAVLGSNNNDTISGRVAGDGTTTLSSIDFINAGDHTAQGGDTLNIDLSANYNGGATIQNIEVLKLTASVDNDTTSRVFNTNGVTSFTKVINNSSSDTLEVTNLLKSVLDIEINNISGVDDFGTGNSDIEGGLYTWAGSQLTGTETLNIVLDSVGTSTGAVTNTADILVGSGGSTSFKDISISSNGSNSNFIRLNSDVAQTTVKALDLNGTKALTLALDAGTTAFGGNASIATTAITIDASDMTGGLTLSGLGAAIHTVTGGSGDDVILFGANFTIADTVNGGSAGVDVLGGTGATLAAITTTNKASLVSSIETIFITDDLDTTSAIVDLSLFGTGASNVRIADQTEVGTGVATVNNLASGGVARFDGDSTLGAAATTSTTTAAAVVTAAAALATTATTANVTALAVANVANVAAIGADAVTAVTAAGAAGTLLNVKGAGGAGTNDSLTIDLRGGAFSTVEFTVNNVENLTIDTTNATGNQALVITDAALENVIVTGSQSVDLTNSTSTLGAIVKTVDASGLTGSAALNVSLNAAAAVGAKVTGSANADTIVGSDRADDLIGNGGIDTITGGAGADKLTGGAGNDIFIINTVDAVVLAATSQSGDTIASGASAAALDVITDATVGDVIQFAGAVSYTLTTGGGANAYDPTIGTAISGAENTINLVRGNYDAATELWVSSASGSDSLLVYDQANDTGSAVVDHEAIVLVGFINSASTLTLDTVPTLDTLILTLG